MIRMVKRVYGFLEKGVVIPKDKDSPPFKLPAKQEKRLVELGVAEYAATVNNSEGEPS